MNNNENMEVQKKNNNSLVIVMGVVIVVLLAAVAYLYFNKTDNSNNLDNNKNNNVVTDNNNNDNEKEKEREEEEPEKEETDTNVNTVVTDNKSLFQVSVNNVVIKFPATKASFEKTGWVWDSKYANTDLAGGYTTSGGRIGTYPGGVVVSVINDSKETKHISDCIIDDGTFYNPNDGSKDVVFVGGITFSSTQEEVKNIMSGLGYKNVKERNYETSNYYTYYAEDNESNFRDYIEFYFYKGKINSVGVHTAGR